MGPELVGYFVRFHISLNDTHQGKKLMGIDKKPLGDREFQFVYVCFLLSNTQFIMQQNFKDFKNIVIFLIKQLIYELQ